jgi:LPXTG-site transpeptidase (sortase) family protein
VQTDNTISIQIDDSEKKKSELETILSKYDWNDVVQKETTETIQNSLEAKMKDYSFDFNVVPPTNRLTIWKINLDVPIVDSKYKNESDFTQWNFDAELENWVVKYPTTPEPGKIWNTLIFWHTSQEWREKNPYWTVFSKIPNLDLWDEITVIRWWKLYKYKIIEKTIVAPKNVDAQYKKYQDWDFITLMWCYPIWRTDKRMMITAERIG